MMDKNPWIVDIDGDCIFIVEHCIDILAAMDVVRTDSAGAISSFVGVTRDHFEGKRVLRLEYEGYVPMAVKELKRIACRIRELWHVEKIAIVHRLGVVPIGEASVAIVISSSHRKASLCAVDYAINTLKKTVPIWKKEYYNDDESMWKSNCECTWSS